MMVKIIMGELEFMSGLVMCDCGVCVCLVN